MAVSPRSDPSPSDPPAPVGVAGHVLCIEEHPAGLRLVRGVFDLWPDLRLRSAGGVADGLACIRDDPPDLVLVDGNVMDRDGDQVLRRIRAARPATEMAIMVISSDPSPSRAVEVLASGADEYLVEPFDDGHLQGLVARLTAPRPAPPAT
jgi:DNA-binding response OmpR family regulator